MIRILFFLVFILSVAFASGGIALSSRIRNINKSEIFSFLLYYQVFIFTFGFYVIWGQVLIKAFLASYISTELFTRFSNIALLMGLPFLVFAWLMLIQFSSGISGKKNSKWLIFWFLFLNFSILIILGYIIARENTTEPATLIRNYFIVMNLIYSLLASYLIHLPGKGRSVIHEYDRRIISPVLFIIIAAQCISLWFYSSQPWSGLVFIFAFFAGNIFLPVYFSYGKLLPEFASEPVRDISFEEFCMKYEVSPRESDIVREICNGLSNKEISERLFISLQTVKDHTHRIYIKTNVRSRVQLITLVKEELTPPSMPPNPPKGGL
jgi:DNA-binding CsgD family transcriptional regulator